MGQGNVGPTQMPAYNAGWSTPTNSAPQDQNTPGGYGGGGPGGSFYTPKMGMPTYIGGYQPQADVNLINEIPQVASGTGTMQGYINQYLPSMNSPQMTQPTSYSPAATSAIGNEISANALQYQPYANQAMQTGFDPQNALYQNTAQQLTDQTRAAEAAAGVAGTPYGAQLEGRNMADFNLNWINQEQQRQQAGAQTAMGILQGAGQEAAAGQQLAQAGPSFQTSMLSSLMGNTTQALQPQQTALEDYLNYLGHNQQASLTASQQNIAGTSSLLDFISQNQSGSSSGGKSSGSSGMGGIGQAVGSLAGGGKMAGL